MNRLCLLFAVVLIAHSQTQPGVPPFASLHQDRQAYVSAFQQTGSISVGGGSPGLITPGIRSENGQALLSSGHD